MAAIALLAFKGLGLVTNGGYVLLGTESVQAAGGGGDHGGAARETVAADSGHTLQEPTLEDRSPTIGDATPTLPLKGEGEAAGHGAAASTASSDHGAPAAADHGETAHLDETNDRGICGEGTLPAPALDPITAAAARNGVASDEIVASAPCVPDPGVNAYGDAVPLMTDGNGNLVPMTNAGGSASAGALEERLTERRTELDTREQELDLRMGLVEAAEKRIEERTAMLEALETRINSLIDENKAAGDEQFAGVVSMYETMKPKEAAAIFDELDMPPLLRGARAVSP